MPIYEYQCNECEHKLEVLQKMSDEVLRDCPACGKQALRKLVSAAAFRLSGSGWYETDFKDKKQQKNLSSSDNKSQASSDSKKTDSAGEKKTDSGAGSTSKAKPAESKKSTNSTSTPVASSSS